MSHAQLGALPVSRTALLLAEIPAGLLEVFPLLGAAGLVFANLGLAVHMPAAWPFILLLTVQGLAAMQALLFLTASLRRMLGKRRLWALLAGAGIFVALVAVDLQDLRWFVRQGAPSLIPWLPGSQGYAGLLELRTGHGISGAVRLAAGLAATGGLLGLAAWVHQRESALEPDAAGRAGGRSAVLRFRHPAAGVGRLFQKQLLDSKLGRTTLALPVLLTLPLAAVLVMVRLLVEKGGVFSDRLSEIERLADLPLFGIFLFVLVVINAPIWMNPFGWDRGGVRTLLLLPIAPPHLLLGKLLGLARFTGLQAALGALPLIWVNIPSVAEVVAGLGAAGTAFVVTAAVGQLLAVRFPRPVARDSAANLPLYLSWISTAVVAATTVVLGSVYLLARGLGPWAPPAAAVGVLVLVLACYVCALPMLGRRLEARRERLLGMALLVAGC